MYALRSTRATFTPTDGSAVGRASEPSTPSPGAAFEYVAEFTFKGGQAGVEQFPLRHDDYVESWGELVPSEHLPHQSFRPVPDHRTTQLPGGGDTEPAGRQAVRKAKQGETASVNFDAPVVDLLVFGSFANTLAAIESGHDPRCRTVHPCGDNVLLAADRQALAPLGATALENETAVLGGHANKKTVRLRATARIRLERALTLHDLSGSPRGALSARN